MFVLKMSRPFSSFVKKMADIVANEGSMAQRVQTNVINELYSAEHEAKLRKKMTIEQSIDNLQKEMRQQIAQALKRSEFKVKYYFSKAEEKLKQHEKSPFNKKQKEEYNLLRKQCEKARWEYMVHRQSCGFTIKNYEIVTKMYPLPPILQ